MRVVENFLLLCGLQTIAFSVLLLICVLAVQLVGRRRTTMLIASGLGAMVLIWLVALVPMSGWLTVDSVRELVSNPSVEITASDTASQPFGEEASVQGTLEQNNSVAML